jgi:hypothetical protein
MSSETDDLVVAHLREVHAELHGIAAMLEDHSQRFELLQGSLENLRPLIDHALSLTSLNQLKVSKLEADRDAAAVWQKRFEERLDGLERRLAKVEEKLGI